MEVEIKVSYCGMCHTDLHLINNDVGITPYPLYPVMKSLEMSHK